MTFLLKIAIYLIRKTQIALLIAKKILVLAEYLDFLDIFSKKKTLILLKITKLNQFVIELQKSQQPFHKPIYSLGLIKLEIFRIYIKINPVNSFIWPLKAPVGTFIFFI